MKTSLLNGIESWASNFALETKEIRSTEHFIVIEVNNFSITSHEIRELEKTIQYWFEEAHWHSIDQMSDGLEIWIAI